MGFSSFITGPLVEVFGRRKAYNVALVIFLGCSIGTALAPNLGVFVGMRTFSAFEGTLFMVVGQTILADIFEPVSSVPVRTLIQDQEGLRYILKAS